MSHPVGPGRPPVESRFRKGQSGNPNGRPKKAKPPAASAFDIVIDRTMTVTQGGVSRALTVDEALQLRTYQEAVAGSRPARREILRMIARRELYLAGQDGKKQDQPIEFLTERDPDNAEAALLILGVIAGDPREAPGSMNLQLLLEPWAVQAAFARRRGGPRLSVEQVSEIERCTRDPGSIRWPRGTRE